MLEDDAGNIMERAVTKTIPISDLRLDSENVRLKHLRRSMTESEIEDYFWENERATQELYLQIKAANGLYQDLIVTENGIVKEGNRRLICLRRLQREAHAGELADVPKTQFDNVKCSVLSKDATERQISLLLATIHVRGRKAWDPFNKAEMLDYLNRELKTSYDSLSKELGMSKVTIIKMVNAYRETKRYGEEFPDDSDWYRNYTYFDELFRRRSLKSWRENPGNITLFFSWIHENKLSEHKQVRCLDRILESEVSRRIFDERGYDAAIDFLNKTDPTIQDSDFRKISRTIKTLQSFDRKALIKIIKDPSRIKMLQNLRNEVNSLLKDINAIGKAEEENDEGN